MVGVSLLFFAASFPFIGGDPQSPQSVPPSPPWFVVGGWIALAFLAVGAGTLLALGAHRLANWLKRRRGAP